MSQELQLGKYEFYPYEFDKSTTPTLEELKELLRKAKAMSGKDVTAAGLPQHWRIYDARNPSRSVDRSRFRHKGSR